MKNSPELIALLDIDSRLQKLINKEIEIPAYLDNLNSVDEHWYPHPPCMIPLFLGHGASYKGIIKHFFCDRKVTYVEYYLEQGYMSEIARNPEQFITLMVLKMTITKDELTEDIIDLCDQLNYSQAHDVDRFAVDYGDDPKDFAHLPYFDRHRPFKYLRDLADYDGDFPSSIYLLNKSHVIQNSSIYEIAVEEQLSKIQVRPSWLVNGGDKKVEFYDYLNNGQFKAAWFTLNTKGWDPEDTAIALKALAYHSGDKGLAIVADYWITSWKKSK